MATTKIDICARALIMIGAQPISSFSDGSTEALVASNIYDDVVEASLTRHRWRFATTQQQLSLLTSAPTGRYDYAYQVPTSPAVLQIITLTVNDYVIPYSRYQNYIYLNGYGANNEVIMDYIYKVDEQYFPPHFRLALEYELAALFAGSVARDNGLIEQFKTLSERQFLIARNIDSTETTSKVLDTNRFINARRSTRTDA
tara:strand:+ start:3339 stop:3938 length:600 start_codon:yes stop_codon:yes gene_type:complete